MTTELLAPRKIPRNLYKGCRRCGGDLRMERDYDQPADNAYEYRCLQCGRSTPLRTALRGAQPQANHDT